MSWITDKLLGFRRVISGVETLPERGTLEFAGDGVTVADDTTNKRTVVTIAGGGTENALVLSETHPTEAGQFYVDEFGRLWGYCAPQAIASTLAYEIESPVRCTDRLDVAATTMTERILSDGIIIPEMTVISAYYVPEAGLTANDSDYATIRVSHRNTSTGGSKTLMFEVNTTTSGVDFTGNWTAWKPVPLVPGGGTRIPANRELTWEIVVGGGSGVTVPSGRIFIQCVRAAATFPEL